MWFLIGCFVGVLAGVFLMCLMQMARDPLDVEGCTQDCNQGRQCNCATCKHCYGIGYDASGYSCTCVAVRERFDRESA
jgi:hypothetical protein